MGGKPLVLPALTRGWDKKLRHIAISQLKVGYNFFGYNYRLSRKIVGRNESLPALIVRVPPPGHANPVGFEP